MPYISMHREALVKKDFTRNMSDTTMIKIHVMLTSKLLGERVVPREMYPSSPWLTTPMIQRTNAVMQRFVEEVSTGPSQQNKWAYNADEDEKNGVGCGQICVVATRLVTIIKNLSALKRYDEVGTLTSFSSALMTHGCATTNRRARSKETRR